MMVVSTTVVSISVASTDVVADIERVAVGVSAAQAPTTPTSAVSAVIARPRRIVDAGRPYSAVADGHRHRRSSVVLQVPVELPRGDLLWVPCPRRRPPSGRARGGARQVAAGITSGPIASVSTASGLEGVERLGQRVRRVPVGVRLAVAVADWGPDSRRRPPRRAAPHPASPLQPSTGWPTRTACGSRCGSLRRARLDVVGAKLASSPQFAQ